MNEKYRLALFSPLNPIQSGISDYSEELLPELSRYFDIDLYVDNFTPSSPQVLDNFGYYNISQFAQQRQVYNLSLYHMGNNPYHLAMLENFMRFGGAVVLHDYILHHVMMHHAWEGDWNRYLAEVRYCYGSEYIEHALESQKHNREPDYWNYAMNRRLVDRSDGMIVHSEYIAEKLREASPAVPVAKVNMGMPILPASDGKDNLRKRLNLPQDAVVIGSFGHIEKHKRLEEALKVFAELRKTNKNIFYLLAGKRGGTIKIDEVVEKAGLESCVRVTGFLEFDEMIDYMYACDVVINLRYPTAGETSATVIRALGCGLPVVVSDVGQFREFPDNCTVKIPVDENEEAFLISVLRELIDNKPLRHAMSKNAVRYVERAHSVQRTASDYARFLYGLIRKKETSTPQEMLLSNVRQACVELGIG
jgi:glycosyltransferase involved in cell wall biosynthesis